jgi:hypothetical protein
VRVSAHPASGLSIQNRLRATEQPQRWSFSQRMASALNVRAVTAPASAAMSSVRSPYSPDQSAELHGAFVQTRTTQGQIPTQQ